MLALSTVVTASSLPNLPAQAFDASVLASVVSVLPERRGPARQKHAGIEPEGSGVAVYPGGYVATNAHVITASESVKIRLEDGRLVTAEIVGIDMATDLALLKTAIDLPVLSTADPPRLGAAVCAVGNQFGLGLSVTCGVVSATRRTGTGFNAIEDFIQTDAAVNPGGSGGALVDDRGRLVGLVSAIFTKTSDADIGINFATSAELLYRVMDDFKAFGRVARGNPGLITDPLPAEFRERVAGVRVSRVTPSGAGDRAGLQAGDIIRRVGARRTLMPSDFPSAIHLARPGDTVEIEYQRGAEVLTTGLTLPP